VKRGGSLARSPMPARAKPMDRGRGLAARTGLRRGKPLAQVSAKRAAAPKRTPRKDTGFSPAVKLAIRTRAGNGDPDQARCEATGVWLGRYGGEVQHRVARLSGGRGRKAPWWFRTAANGALLSRAAHRLAEARDGHMHAAGFWLTSTQDATAEPIMLHDSSGGGVTVWLAADGTYAFQPPGGAA
jgi:hypothetical protein